MPAELRDGVLYYVELRPGGRGQMVADLIEGGEVVATWEVGSPAPIDVVRRALEQMQP